MSYSNLIRCVVFLTTCSRLTLQERPDAGPLPSSLLKASAQLHSEVPVEIEASSGGAFIERRSNATLVRESEKENVASMCYLLYFTEVRDDSQCQNWIDDIDQAASIKDAPFWSDAIKNKDKFMEVSRILARKADGDNPAEVEDTISRVLKPALANLWTLATKADGHDSKWEYPLQQLYQAIKVYGAIQNAKTYLQENKRSAGDDEAQVQKLEAAIAHNGLFKNHSAKEIAQIVRGERKADSWFHDLGRGETEALKLIDRLSGGKPSKPEQPAPKPNPVGPISDGFSSGSLDEVIVRGKEALATGDRMEECKRELNNYIEQNGDAGNIVDARLVLAVLNAMLQRGVHTTMDKAITEGEDALSYSQRNSDGASRRLMSATNDLEAAIAVSQEPIWGGGSQSYNLFMSKKWNAASTLLTELNRMWAALEASRALVLAIEGARNFLRSGGFYDPSNGALEQALQACAAYKDDVSEYEEGVRVLAQLKEVARLQVSLRSLLSKAEECMGGGCNDFTIGDESSGLIHDLRQSVSDVRGGGLQKALQDLLTTAEDWIRKLQLMKTCGTHLRDLVAQGNRMMGDRDGHEGIGRAIKAKLEECSQFSSASSQQHREARDLQVKLMGLGNARQGLESAIQQGNTCLRQGTEESDAVSALTTALDASRSYNDHLGELIQKATTSKNQLESRYGARDKAKKAIDGGKKALNRRTGEEDAISALKAARAQCGSYGKELASEITQIDQVLKDLHLFSQYRIITRELEAALRKADEALGKESGADDALRDLIPVTFYAAKFKSDKGLQTKVKSGKRKLQQLAQLSLRLAHKERMQTAVRNGQRALSDNSGTEDCALGELLGAMEEFQTFNAPRAPSLAATLNSSVSGSAGKEGIQLVGALMAKVEARGLAKRLRETNDAVSRNFSSNTLSVLMDGLRDLYPAWLRATAFQKESKTTLPGNLADSAKGTLNQLIKKVHRIKYEDSD